MAKIGVDARLTYYTQGGIAQYTQQLIHEYTRVRTSHSFEILQSRKDDRNLTAASSKLHRKNCWTPSHHRLERLALAVELLPMDLDLLHSPDFIPPLRAGYKSVITIHDLAFLHYPEFLTQDSRRYYNDQIKAAVQKTDHIIAVSESTRQDVVNLLKTDPSKISVVLEGVSDDFHPQEKEKTDRVRSQFDLPPGYILFVSTIEPRKNVKGLLEAYHLLRSQVADLPPLVLAGDRGWLSDEVYLLAETHKLGNNVRWLGKVPYDALPSLYSGATVFCLPSFYEGFGLTPLEAMACGTPVVISDRSSLPEIVGDAGLLVDPEDAESIKDALMRVLSDGDLASSMRNKGLARAAGYTWRHAAEETIAVYDKVLGL